MARQVVLRCAGQMMPDCSQRGERERAPTYGLSAHRNLGQDALAQVYAEEVLRLGTSQFGEERSPMRNAEARITLAVVAARAGDLDEAVSQGMTAFAGSRQSIPSLSMVAQELSARAPSPSICRRSTSQRVPGRTKAQHSGNEALT